MIMNSIKEDMKDIGKLLKWLKMILSLGAMILMISWTDSIKEIQQMKY